MKRKTFQVISDLVVGALLKLAYSFFTQSADEIEGIRKKAIKTKPIRISLLNLKLTRNLSLFCDLAPEATKT